MQAVALLPRACGDPTVFSTFKHPRTGNDASFLITGSTIYEFLRMDRPHSSWFLGNSALSSGATIIASPIHPLFLVITFLERRSPDPLPLSAFFADSPYASIASILLPHIPKVCVGEADNLVYDHAKAVAWIADRCSKLGDFFRRNRPELRDEVTIEMGFDAVRHFLHRSLATEVREFLAARDPRAFRPRAIEPARTDESPAEKKTKSAKTKKQAPTGLMAITAFFAPRPAPK